MLSVLLQSTPAQQPAGFGNFGLLFIVAIFAVMYLFMIRPQQKRQKELRAFQNALQKGSKVVIAGGIYGTVVELKETSVLVEVDNNVKLRVDKGSIVRDPSDAPAR